MKQSLSILIYVLLLFSCTMAECTKNVFTTPLVAKGVYVTKKPSLGFEMATLLAQENLAKQLSNVKQTETSTLTQSQFHSVIQTVFQNSIDSFEIKSKSFNAEKSTATVVITMQPKKANTILCNISKK